MSSPVCRVGDGASGHCTVHNVNWTGIWATGSSTLFDSGHAVVVVGSTGSCTCGHIFTATTGSSVLTAGGVAVHRIADTITCSGGGSTAHTSSSPTLSST